MRLFIGAKLADEHVEALLAAQRVLQANSEQLSLTKPENLHLTLHFLGELDQPEVLLAQEVMMRAKFPAKEELSGSIAGYGSFKRNDGELVFAKLDASEGCYLMLEQIYKGLKKNNLPLPDRPWLPHITLARRTRLHVTLEDLAAELPVTEEPVELQNIILFKSEFTDNGMRYTPILRRV